MFIDCSVNSPKLQLVSEPWDENDLSYKNRATVSVYVDELNCGFSCFLRHPSEVGKKFTKRDGTNGDLSSMPIQARLDRIRFTIVMRSILRLVSEKEYMGTVVEAKNFWYDDKGEVILTDGKKKPCHTATVKTGRDSSGCIFIAIKEEKHPHKEQRPGAIFKFNSGPWFDIKDNVTNSTVPKPEDSKLNAEAYAINWQDAVFKCLDENYKIFMEKKKKAYEAKRGNQTQETSTPSSDWG